MFNTVRSGSNAMLAWITNKSSWKDYSEKYYEMIVATCGWSNGLLLRADTHEKQDQLTEMLDSMLKPEPVDFLYNFENEDVKSFTDFHMRHMPQIAYAKKIIPMVLMRDPYNLLASMLKHYGHDLCQSIWLKAPKGKDLGERQHTRNKIPVPSLRDIYIGYIKEFQGETNYIKYPSKVFINYNEWVDSDEYKESIRKKLLIPTHHVSSIVRNNGGGSSFDKLRYNRKAGDMAVNDRYKEYLSLTDDEEIRTIGKDIFNMEIN